jgi:hypothetical protein
VEIKIFDKTIQKDAQRGVYKKEEKVILWSPVTT